MWPEIKEKYPNAELHITYGWNLFDVANRTNPERQEWKKNVQMMMNQEGIVEHGRVGQQKLKKIRKMCGIWAYPTYFTEINCITALECQHDGVVPVTMTLAALKETVGSGVKVKGDISDPKIKKLYLEELLNMMGDGKKWKLESKRGKKWAKKYYWNKIASKWDGYFSKSAKEPKVSVVTITIREGFWNIMAKNLSQQTYKNFEWIIVDDHKDDRAKIAQKYGKKYGLDIKYIRGDKVLKKYNRRYGLVRANNIGWKAAKGELIVWLQDFIIIPRVGIDKLVNLYNHNPNAIYAPVDVYMHCAKPNRDNKEDWWDGATKMLTEQSWKNVRVEYLGIRKTEYATDFEMNYSAMPKRIIEELNGWWEFFDDGLGFDNTEIAYRVLQKGYDIIIDDTNIANCIDLWPILRGEPENIVDREIHLSTPQWIYFQKKKFDPVRDEKIDESISLDFRVPKGTKPKDADKWINKNAERIADKWIKEGK
jgi:glycosyltransferase involved in cell wall biosynthesis